jgi:hypothetical protein
MNIEEYADALNLQLEITRYPNQSNRYTARFANCETKDDADSGCLTSAYGNGHCPGSAIDDYLDKIRGRVLVVDAMSPDNRRQYVVPKAIRS